MRQVTLCRHGLNALLTRSLVMKPNPLCVQYCAKVLDTLIFFFKFRIS